MTESSTVQTFERLAQKIEPSGRLLRAWELKGGVSARVTALEIERPGGQIARMIVRQHGAADLKRNPRIAADEFRLLRLLRSAGISVPAPYYLDESDEIFAAPCVVVAYVEGSPELAPADPAELACQLATQLVAIHTVGPAAGDLSFLPSQERQVAALLRARPAVLDATLSEERIRDTLEPVWPLVPRNSRALLHGDFWPGNILWKDGRVAAVVDWEDAAVGDPLADIANARLELLWAFGVEAMERFTRQYRTLAARDFTDLPYWDLCAALRPIGKIAGWGLEPADERRMRERLGWFAAEALGALGR